MGRVLEIPLTEVDRIAKLIPSQQGKPVTLAEALQEVPALREAYDQADYVRNLIDTAVKLEGVVRNAGTHAAGVVIADRPLVEYVPLHRATHESLEQTETGAVTQYEMQVLENLGLLKVDLLGLSTLTVMQRTCDLVRRRHGKELDLDSIPTDDAAIFDLLGRGEVAGVFQVEGSGMRRYLMEMRPTRLDHVIAMIALFRPGPIEFIPEYIQRMRGAKPVAYRHPALESILCETYGILIYQEQLMRAVIELAGFSPAEADNLRKAVSKKNAEAIQKHRVHFIAGAAAVMDIPEDQAASIFDDWQGFARYGFNKAHAADYGVICAQTAFLKAHYPVEFMTALLSASKNDSDKVAMYIVDCRRMNIPVLPPDIGFSGWDFTIEAAADGKQAVRFGMGAVRNVGEGAVGEIIRAREKDGPFQSHADLACRVDLRRVGKRPLEALIKVGALDRLGDRAALLNSLDRILSVSAAHFRAAEAGQMTFFSAGSTMPRGETISLAAADAIPRSVLLEWEKDLLGLYVSDHPISPYMEDLQKVITHFSSELNEETAGQRVKVAGLVTNVRPYQTKSGKMMCFVTLEDLYGPIDVTIFPKLWDTAQEIVTADTLLIVSGKAEAGIGTPKVLAEKVTTEFTVTDPAPPAVQPPVARTQPPTVPPEPCADDWLPPPGDPWEEIAEGAVPAAPVAVVPSPGGDAASVEPSAAERRASYSETPPVPFGLSFPEAATPRVEGPCMITIHLRESGDRVRDARRLRILHGFLSSFPGRDHFAFLVSEESRTYRLEFPSDTTTWSADLEKQIHNLTGPDGIEIRPMQVM